MKKIISFLILSIFFVTALTAQLDRSQRPEPGPAPTIELDEFETFIMDNGITVIVVEDRQVPVISFQLTVDRDPVLEGDAKGYSEFAGRLMREGTENRDKQEIDEAIDFIGASLSTHSTGIFASSLTRHKDDLLKVMADVLMNPTFPEEELERRLNQKRTELRQTESSGSAIRNNISRAVVYGDEHPYGEITTQETLDNITADHLKEYYDTYFKPNISYLVIVGDIDKEGAKDVMEEYFAGWEEGEVPSHDYPTPQPPENNRVGFGERSGASQSSVHVTYPVVLTPGHEDAIKTSVMNSVLGGGVFSGRLMQNLREDKGYTYGARSGLSTDPVVSRFHAGAEVRNEVTDSTVAEILYEMERLINEPVEKDELELIQNFMTGQFARSLERPRTIARYAMNIERYDLPEDYYATYLERLNAVTTEEVQQMAQKYLKPENSYIVVAGNKEEVPETLEKFSPTGEVEFYDEFGRPDVPAEVTEVPDGVTIETVINDYYEAIGGKENFDRMEDMTQVMKTSMQGQEITITQYQKAPDLLKVETALGENVVSTQLFDGKKAVVQSMMGTEEYTEGEQFEQMKLQAIMNREMNYEDYGFEKNLEGIEQINGKEAYKVEVISPQDEKSIEYYDVESGYKIKVEAPESTAKYSDYKPTTIKFEKEDESFFGRLFGRTTEKEAELKFPHKIEQQVQQQVLEMETVEIKINSGLTEDDFKIE